MINKKWAVKTVRLKIYRLGVNEHLREKKKQFNQDNKPHSLTLSCVTVNNVLVRISSSGKKAGDEQINVVTTQVIP